LQLLSDFVADMRIVAMKLSQVISLCIDIGQHKIGFVKGSDYIKNVQGPTSALYGQILNRGKAAICIPDTPAGQCLSIDHYRNFCVCRNFREKNVATYSSGPAELSGLRAFGTQWPKVRRQNAGLKSQLEHASAASRNGLGTDLECDFR
jgi:hypothetical protein